MVMTHGNVNTVNRKYRVNIKRKKEKLAQCYKNFKSQDSLVHILKQFEYNTCFLNIVL